MTKENSNARQLFPFPENGVDLPVVNGGSFVVSSGSGDQSVRAATDTNIPTDWVHSAGKRCFDVTVALLGVACSLPLLLLIAIVIKLTSPGPVLFRQRRIGRGHVPFTIYKYRTMYAYSKTWGPRITRNSDRRMTAFGCLLRKLKLDELPQLFNVIRGDMSLVGPRPKLEEHERMEMVCRPGITGAATLVFAREEELLNEVPEDSFEDFTVQILNSIKATLDTQHAENSTFFSDLRIIAETVVTSRSKKAVTSLAELYERYGSDAWESAVLTQMSERTETYLPMLRSQPEVSDCDDLFMPSLPQYANGENAVTAPY